MKGPSVSHYKYPLTPTWSSVRLRFDQHFRENSDQQFIDAGESITYYKFNLWKIPKYDCREFISEGETTYRISHDQLPSKIKFHLTEVANAYKWRSEDHLKSILDRIGNLIRLENIIGYHVDDDELNDFIEHAISNKDSMEVQPNESIRILENPYFNGTEVENDNGRRCIIPKDTVIKKQEKIKRKSDFTNNLLGQEKRVSTYDAIMTALCDYDLNQGLITRAKIAAEVGVKERTVKRYISDHEELADVFRVIRQHTRKCTPTYRAQTEKSTSSRVCTEIQSFKKGDNRSIVKEKGEVSQKEVYGLISLKPRQRPKMIDVIREYNKKKSVA